MHNGQDQEIYIETTKHPIGAIHGEGVGFIWQKRDNKWPNQPWFCRQLLKKSLKIFIVCLNLCCARECGGDFGKIDCLDLEQGDDDRGQTFDASQMPPKVEFEQIDEHGSMVHSVISCSLGFHGKGCCDPSTIGDYTLSFNRLYFLSCTVIAIRLGLISTCLKNR